MALTWARVAGAARTAPLLAALYAACCSTVSADVTNVDDEDAPIVRINIHAGDLIVRTWDRSTVAVDGDPSLIVERHATEQTGGARSILIPAAEAKTAAGSVTLPAESFVSAPMPAGERDVVSIRTASADNVGTVTVTVPSGSVFVFAHATDGDLEVHDYHGGTFVGFATRGRLTLLGVGSTVFAQTGLGPLLALDSSFDRLRVRSLRGNAIFERCSVRQIEATTVSGSIVYDAGTFDAGLARFESTSGNVAVSTTGAADLGGRTMGDGRVYTNFTTDAAVDARDGETTAVVKGGGPVVTATTQSGSVYLYDGSLHDRPLTGDWNAPLQTLQRPAAHPGPAAALRHVRRLHPSYAPPVP